MITYPEFLTKPQRPPPLVTPDGLLTALSALGALTTALYGTQHYLVTPMLESLTEARHTFLDATASQLGRLIDQLEHTVSEPPASLAALAHAGRHAADSDAESSVGDPTELFHRDIGTQTSDPPSPSPAASAAETADEKPLEGQLARLARVTSILQGISRDHTAQAEDLADVRAVAAVVQDEASELAAAGTVVAAEWISSWSAAPRREPDDELKKARDNIRRLKGTLLSTRSFPARQGA